ncbi:MAG: FxDxF family PEP-CTERM protein [Piscinibacter sp.]
MKLRHVAAAAALVMSAPSMAAVCSGGYGLGTLGPPGASWFGESFSRTGSYLDCYSFSLTSAADSFGGTWELDLSPTLSLNVTGFSLFSGGVSGGSTTGSAINGLNSSSGNTNSFSFGALQAGTYTLAVASTVGRTGYSFWDVPVGYIGQIVTTRSTPVASPAPEPATYAMMLLGLAGVVGVARRRKSS